VLTEKLTRQPKLRLAFDVNVNRYNGGDWPVLTLGGKTRDGTAIRAVYSADRKTDVFQIRTRGNEWTDIAPFKMKDWNRFEVVLAEKDVSVSVNASPAVVHARPLLRKICFGGLYIAPEWPMGMSRSSDVRLKLESIIVE
jgi:hypothetical protein